MNLCRGTIGISNQVEWARAHVRWAVFQMKEGQLTLRISKKNNREKPKISRQVGKTDKLIKDYLEVYETFKNF